MIRRENLGKKKEKTCCYDDDNGDKERMQKW